MLQYFKVVIEKDEDGVYIASVPELPGCISDGKTKREALKNIREAIAGYVETLEDKGWSLPKIISVNRVAVEIHAQVA
jgi:predicted RNase H-like HicB family nuclease